MANTAKSRLKKAVANRTLVRFDHRLEPEPIVGYVVDIGAEFCLLALVSERVYFDGFERIRIKDIRNLNPDPYARFTESALKKRRQRVRKKPRIVLRDIRSILLSASRAFPIIALQDKTVDPRDIWIGRILKIEGKYVAMREISPDAIWDEQPSLHRLSEITRINFGGDYENALYLVGGEPPHGITSKAKAVRPQNTKLWKKQNKK